jgi:hypothetical protein
MKLPRNEQVIGSIRIGGSNNPRSSLKERGRVKAVVTSGLGVFDRGAHVEIGVGVKARAEPDRVAAGGP